MGQEAAGKKSIENRDLTANRRSLLLLICPPDKTGGVLYGILYHDWAGVLSTTHLPLPGLEHLSNFKKPRRHTLALPFSSLLLLAG